MATLTVIVTSLQGILTRYGHDLKNKSECFYLLNVFSGVNVTFFRCQDIEEVIESSKKVSHLS